METLQCNTSDCWLEFELQALYACLLVLPTLFFKSSELEYRPTHNHIHQHHLHHHNHHPSQQSCVMCNAICIAKCIPNVPREWWCPHTVMRLSIKFPFHACPPIDKLLYLIDVYNSLSWYSYRCPPTAPACVSCQDGPGPTCAHRPDAATMQDGPRSVLCSPTRRFHHACWRSEPWHPAAVDDAIDCVATLWSCRPVNAPFPRRKLRPPGAICGNNFQLAWRHEGWAVSRAFWQAGECLLVRGRRVKCPIIVHAPFDKNEQRSAFVHRLTT